MTEPWFPDSLAVIISGLSDQLPDLWVADRLPEPIDDDLPAVWVNPLPGGSMNVPWNTSAPLTDAPSFDIDILSAASKGPKFLNDTAARVRRALFTLADLPKVARVIEDVPLAARPDWNPRVLRVGGEYSLILPRT